MQKIMRWIATYTSWQQVISKVTRNDVSYCDQQHAHRWYETSGVRGDQMCAGAIKGWETPCTYACGITGGPTHTVASTVCRCIHAPWLNHLIMIGCGLSHFNTYSIEKSDRAKKGPGLIIKCKMYCNWCRPLRSKRLTFNLLYCYVFAQELPSHIPMP